MANTTPRVDAQAGLAHEPGPTWRRPDGMLLLAVTVTLLAVAAGASGNYYVTNVAANVGVLYIIAIAMTLLLRYSDQVSIAQAAFWGVGAYATGIAQVHFGLGPGLSFVLSITSACLLGLIVAVPLVRLRHHFLAMATLAFQLIFTAVIVQAATWTGGSPGLIGIVPITVGDVELVDELFLIPLTLSILVVILIFRNATSFRFGRASTAIRVDELMAESLGVNVGANRVATFVLASGLTGLAGFLQAELTLLITPAQFSLPISVTFLAMVVIGGAGRILGPILGVSVYYLSTQLLAEWPDYQALLFGVVIVAVMLWMPGGVTGLLSSVGERTRTSVDRSRVMGAAARTSRRLDLPAFTSEETPSRGGDDTVLEIHEVDKSFGGVAVLHAVDLRVPAQGVTALLGPNGAGKSTLFNVVNGITPADSGTVTALGVDITRYRPARIAQLGVGRTFQNPRLIDDVDCLTNVMLGAHRLEPYGRLRNYIGVGLGPVDRRARARAREALDFLGLGDFANVPVRQMPFGARKVLELGRVLNMSPRLLLLDEPGAGLNEEEGNWLGSVLLDVVKESGVPIVIVDHRLDLIRQVADLAVMLHEGRVLVEGTVDEVLSDPRVEEAYLGAVIGAEEAP